VNEGFLTFALDGSRRPSLHPSHFNPGKGPRNPFERRLVGL